MPDFSVRSTQAEIMDDLNAPEKELRQNLHELEIVNKYLGGYKGILATLDKLSIGNDVTIMDVGSGGGDTLRAVAQWARQRNKRVSLVGVDFNPVMINYATEHSAQYPEINYKTSDIFDAQLDNEKADIVICSLFCHHFPHHDLVRLIRRMQQLATHTVIINDLHRHWLAYHSIWLLTRLFSKTYIVKNDGPLSVARAFTRADLEKIMHDADITHYAIQWRWAFRWLVTIKVNDQ